MTQKKGLAMRTCKRPGCSKGFEPTNARHVYCDEECSTKMKTIRGTLYRQQIKDGIRVKNSKTGGDVPQYIVDVKCPKCERMWKLYSDTPPSRFTIRLYCDSCRWCREADDHMEGIGKIYTGGHSRGASA